MAAPPPAPPPTLKPEIGADGLARDSPVIAYTEKVILEEQLQLKKYIQENYSKIREVEKELENLTFEMKLTAGPKKAALEHFRKKIEMSTEKIRLAKVKEEQAKKIDILRCIWYSRPGKLLRKLLKTKKMLSRNYVMI